MYRSLFYTMTNSPDEARDPPTPSFVLIVCFVTRLSHPVPRIEVDGMESHTERNPSLFSPSQKRRTCSATDTLHPRKHRVPSKAPTDGRICEGNPRGAVTGGPYKRFTASTAGCDTAATYSPCQLSTDNIFYRARYYRAWYPPGALFSILQILLSLNLSALGPTGSSREPLCAPIWCLSDKKTLLGPTGSRAETSNIHFFAYIV